MSIPENLLNEKIPSAGVQVVLQSNKVMFRCLMQYNSMIRSSKKQVISHLLGESEEMQRCLDFCKVVKKELLGSIKLMNENGIDTLFIKSSDILPLDSDNFDILIHEDQRELANEVLRRNGFSFVKSTKEPYKIVYRKTKDGKDYLALHVHSRIGWGGVEFLETEDVWRRHIIKNVDGANVGFINPEHHILVTLAHAFYENAALRLGDILYLTDSFSSQEPDLKAMITASADLRWETVFCAMLLYANAVHNDIYGLPLITANKLVTTFSEILSKEKINKINNLHERMRIFYTAPYLPAQIPLKNYRARQLFSQIISNNSLRLSEKSAKLKHLFSVLLRGTVPRRKRSIIISFIGEDSTGKSTHARKIADAFGHRGYKPSYIWSRGMFRISKPLINLAASLFGSRSNTQSSIKPSQTRAVGQVKTNPLLGKMLVSLVVLEHATQLRSAALFKGFSSQVLIFDRYLHDTIIDSLFSYGQDYTSFFSRFLLNKVGLVASKPGLLVWLKASPRTIIKRRAEENFEEVELKSRIYEQSSREWGAYMLDTDRYTIGQNHLSILERSLRLLYEEE